MTDDNEVSADTFNDEILEALSSKIEFIKNQFDGNSSEHVYPELRSDTKNDVMTALLGLREYCETILLSKCKDDDKNKKALSNKIVEIIQDKNLGSIVKSINGALDIVKKITEDIEESLLQYDEIQKIKRNKDKELLTSDQAIAQHLLVSKNSILKQNEELYNRTYLLLEGLDLLKEIGHLYI